MLEMFRCEPQGMTLTRRGCSRLWESANSDPENEPKPWEGRFKCVNCRLGAEHSGKTVSPMAETLAELNRTCPRCFKLSDRIINTRDGHRLCVSCANRHYEAFKRRSDGGMGRNAKGNRPHLVDVLHSEIVVAIDPSGSRLFRASRVTSLPEILIAGAAGAQIFIGFGRPRVLWGYPARSQSEFAFDALARKPRRKHARYHARMRASTVPLLPPLVCHLNQETLPL